MSLRIAALHEDFVMTYRGTVHGNTIELETDLGIPDGQVVEIDVRVPERSRIWGEGIRRSAGIAADVPGVDEAFEQIERDRKAAQFRDVAG